MSSGMAQWAQLRQNAQAQTNAIKQQQQAQLQRAMAQVGQAAQQYKQEQEKKATLADIKAAGEAHKKGEEYEPSTEGGIAYLRTLAEDDLAQKKYELQERAEKRAQGEANLRLLRQELEDRTIMAERDRRAKGIKEAASIMSPAQAPATVTIGDEEVELTGSGNAGMNQIPSTEEGLDARRFMLQQEGRDKDRERLSSARPVDESVAAKNRAQAKLSEARTAVLESDLLADLDPETGTEARNALAMAKTAEDINLIKARIKTEAENTKLRETMTRFHEQKIQSLIDGNPDKKAGVDVREAARLAEKAMANQLEIKPHTMEWFQAYDKHFDFFMDKFKADPQSAPPGGRAAATAEEAKKAEAAKRMRFIEGK